MNRALICLFSTTLLFAAARSQGDPDTIKKVIDEAKNRSQASKILNSLCDEIGGRVTGSRAIEKGYTWAMKKMISYGLTNVHLEQWGTVPLGFDRGKRQSAKMVSPYESKFEFTTNCWTVGTDKAVRGPAVAMPGSIEDIQKNSAKLKGAWVLMPTPVGMRGADMRKPTPLDLEVDKCGIAGRVYRTNGEYVWTHGVWSDYTNETRPKTPMVIIRKSDFDTVTYNLDKGRKTELEFDLENIFTARDFPCYNVVGEIKGTEKPDEVVIVSGHFDSWNGPGSTGANDDGTGVTTALEAARILVATGAKPKRTIRFILFSGEEQGLLGSAGYVEAHKDELSKISAMLHEDSGQNPHAGIAGLPEMMPILRKAVEPMATAFPEFPVEARETARMSGGGSDHGSFLAKGVPGFFLIKKNILPYLYIWHTQNDTAKQTPDPYLRQMACNMAVLSFNIACADQMLPRVPVASGSQAGDHDHDHEH